MLASKLIGTLLIDPTGSPIGRICDILFDNRNYSLKYVVVARIYISFLKIGFIRCIIPIQLLTFTGHSLRLNVIIEVLGGIIGNPKYRYLRDLERDMKKRDVITLLFISLIIVLLYFGIASSFSIYGQIPLWIITAIILFLPVLILEAQYMDIPEISTRYIYKGKVLDINGNLIGLAGDLELNPRTMKITMILVVPPGFHRIPTWLAEVYEKKGVIKLPVNLVKTFSKDNIVLRIKLGDLRKMYSSSSNK